MSKYNLWRASTRIAQHKRCDVHSSLKAAQDYLAQTANKRWVQASDCGPTTCPDMFASVYYSNPVAEKTFDYILGLFSFHTILRVRNLEMTQDFWNISQNHVYVNVWCKIKLLMHNKQSIVDYKMFQCSVVVLHTFCSMFWQGT